MAYKKLDLKTADKITAADLAHIEDGISNAGSGGGSEAGEWEELEFLSGQVYFRDAEKEIQNIPSGRHRGFLFRQGEVRGFALGGPSFLYPEDMATIILRFKEPSLERWGCASSTASPTSGGEWESYGVLVSKTGTESVDYTYSRQGPETTFKVPLGQPWHSFGLVGAVLPNQ